MRDQKVVLVTYSLIILMTIVGCDEPGRTVLPPDIWNNAYLSIQTDCSLNEHCQYIVTIGPFEEDRELDLTLYARYGIKFRDDLLLHEGIIISDDGRRATIEDIEVQLKGTRIVRIPFSVRSEDELTGEYNVDVTLMPANQVAPIIDPLQIKAFIQNENDDHRPQLLSAQSMFNERYPLTSDDILTSHVQFNDGETRPRYGHLYVKLIAPHAEYKPVITLHSDGIEIKRISPLFIEANMGESRIVEFQFRIVEGDRPREGLHVFSISVEEGNDMPIHQILPDAVSIVSGPNMQQQQWLEKTEADAVSTASGKTAVDYYRESGVVVVTGGIGGGPISGYAETVTTGGQSVAGRGGQLEEEIYAGQSGGGVPEPTCTPTAQPPQPRPTLPLPSPTPPVVAGGSDGASDVPTATPTVTPIAVDKTAVFDPRCNEWKRTISATSNITLLDVYHQHVEESVSEMSPNHFVLVFRLCNSIDTEISEVVLGAGEIYYLPNINRP